MAKGILITEDERLLLQKKLLEKHPNIDATLNNSIQFAKNKVGEKSGLSDSSWNGLFNRKGRYIVLAETRDKFYYYLFSEYREAYLKKHPEIVFKSETSVKKHEANEPNSSKMIEHMPYSFIADDVSEFSIIPNPRKVNDSSFELFTGVWIGYIGALYPRDSVKYKDWVAPLIWEITDSKKGYLLIRRWGANVYFKGFAVIESETISFHLWEQGDIKRPRHSMAKFNPVEEIKSLFLISETWNYGDNKEVLGIREILYSRICKGDSPIPKIIESKDGYFDFGIINGHKVSTQYVPLGNLHVNIQHLLNEFSFIWQNH